MIEKKGTVLTTLDEWEVLAGPKRGFQWQDGRSAKESARAWVEAAPEMPAEIRKVLESHIDIGLIDWWSAEPEARTPFDRFRGEPANLDILVLARDARGPVVVGVEAKADEPFGAPVCTILREAEARFAENPRSKGVARLHRLIRAVFGEAPADHPAYAHVRYQLLTATAATLRTAQIRGAKRAVVLVHEFITDRTTDENHAANRADLDKFIRLIANSPLVSVTNGQLLGPFRLPGKPLVDSEIDFYIGKAVCNLRSPGA